MEDLADYLAEAGAVVGGSAALFATFAFVAASFARDLGYRRLEPLRAAEIGAQLGGIGGLAVFAFSVLGVR